MSFTSSGRSIRSSSPTSPSFSESTEVSMESKSSQRHSAFQKAAHCAGAVGRDNADVKSAWVETETEAESSCGSGEDDTAGFEVSGDDTPMRRKNMGSGTRKRAGSTSSIASTASANTYYEVRKFDLTDVDLCEKDGDNHGKGINGSGNDDRDKVEVAQHLNFRRQEEVLGESPAEAMVKNGNGGQDGLEHLFSDIEPTIAQKDIVGNHALSERLGAAGLPDRRAQIACSSSSSNSSDSSPSPEQQYRRGGTRVVMQLGQDPQPPPLEMPTTADTKLLRILSKHGVIEKIPSRPNGNIEADEGKATLPTRPRKGEKGRAGKSWKLISADETKGVLEDRQANLAADGKKGTVDEKQFASGRNEGGTGAPHGGDNLPAQGDGSSFGRAPGRGGRGDSPGTQGNRGNDEDEDAHAVLLCEIFRNFCSPNPSLDQVERILWRSARRGDDGDVRHPSHSNSTLRQDGLGRSASNSNLNPRMRPSVQRSASEQIVDSGDEFPANCPLPRNVVISMGEGGTSVARLLWREPTKNLLELPRHFQLAFFRILIRLLTNEDDDEYDAYFLDLAASRATKYKKYTEPDATEVDHDATETHSSQGRSPVTCEPSMFSSQGDLIEGWNETDIFQRFGSNATPLLQPGDEAIWAGGGANGSSTSHDACERSRRDTLVSLASQRCIAGKSSRLHSVVRFRCGAEWNRYRDKMFESGSCTAGNGAVDAVLALFRIVTAEKHEDHSSNDRIAQYEHDYLVSPVVRLLGLLCTAGMDVKELRHILSFITMKHENRTLDSGTNHQMIMTTRARLYLIRALTYAADGADSSQHVSKASPRCFFTFGAGKGILLPRASPAWYWPFRSEYGFALWFRAEHFDPDPASPQPVLLSMKTENGAGVEVRLDVFNSTANSKRSAAVAVLVVSVSESVNTSSVVKLQGKVLFSRDWYHIAVRHSSPGLKGYFTSARDEVSIFVDGKCELTGELRFPKNLASSRGVKGARLESLQFGKNFDGQTGTLYVFKEYVSDATVKALYEHTAGASDVVNSDAMDWTSERGAIAKQANTVRSNEDLEVSRLSRRGLSGPSFAANMLDLDLGDDLNAESTGLPIELSRTSLASKMCLVWDPCRTSDKFALEAHIGAHGEIDPGEVQSWEIDGAKSVIGSIGGVQSLLPLFRFLLVEETHKVGRNNARVCEDEETIEEASNFVPGLIFLLAAFLRNSHNNAREILRCGGVEILEQCLHESKHLDSMKFVRKSSRLSKLVVGAMAELRVASSHNLALESKVFSRLLFNVPLWLGGVAESPGVALHVELMPLLLSIAKSNPNKVRDCVDVRELLKFINELTSVDETTNHTAQSTDRVNRFRNTKISPDTRLTITERRQVVDIILEIIATTMAPKTTVFQLKPLVDFISFNLKEWGKASASSMPAMMPLHNEKYTATSKACMLFLYLLQCRPVIPDFFLSLEHCCGDADGVSGWILCCMVNFFDDLIRSLGVRCLTAYLDGLFTASSVKTVAGDDPSATVAMGPADPPLASNKSKRIFEVVHRVGGAMGVGSSHSEVGGRASVHVIYKLLWHFLKCHREHLGDLSHAALVHLLVDDGSLQGSIGKNSGGATVAIPDEVVPEGSRVRKSWGSLPVTQVGIDTSQKLRSSYAVGTILRLLRFLNHTMIERWLFDLLSLTRVSPNSIKEVLMSREWQPCLFNLISEIVEEIGRERTKALEAARVAGAVNFDLNQSTLTEGSDQDGVSNQDMNCSAEDSEGDIPTGKLPVPQHIETQVMVEKEVNVPEPPQKESRAGNRFDLSLKLYSTLLGHCVRQGGDMAYNAVEQSASLQRTCVNGHEVFCIIHSHLLNELTDSGIVSSVGAESSSPSIERNRALKTSARMITNAILLNGTSEMDLATAVKHWRCLRHLTAVTVAVVTKSGYGISDLFDYINQDASTVDRITGGLYGIRLPDGTMSGLGDSQVLVSARKSDAAFEDEIRTRQREGYRMICVTLSSQLLSLLDAFIFPDSLDTSLPASQLHGLALVRSPEPRLGHAQGPLLASLLRLSLVLLSHLEPSSVKFLQCCGRLRCFLHWTLELIRESVALGGYAAAFQALTAPLDRLVLAVVLQCHRALVKCSHVLIEIESTPAEKYFTSVDSRQKNYRRLFRATFELREIVLAVYRGRNEVLRAALSLQAYEALQGGLEEITVMKRQNHDARSSSSKEAGLRAFLNNSWVQGFHDVDMQDDFAIPVQVSNGQFYRKRSSSSRGKEAIEELARESAAIVDEYDRVLDEPFEDYCEDQRRWAETEAVLGLESEGEEALKSLADGHKTDLSDIKRLVTLRADVAMNRWADVNDAMSWWSWDDGCVTGENSVGGEGIHWKLATHPDRLHRRILFVQNNHFDPHEDASYEATLGRERDKALKEHEERQKRRVSHVILNAASSAFYKTPDDEGMVDFPEGDMAYLARILEEEINEEDEESSEDHTVHSLTEQSEDAAGSDWDQISAGQVHFTDGGSGNGQDAIAWAKSFAWNDGEKWVHTVDSVLKVSLRSVVEGELLLTTHSMYFHPTGDEINVMTKEPMANTDKGHYRRKDRRWRLSRLSEVHGRRYMLKVQALEFFFADGQVLFLNFNGGLKVRDTFYAKLRNSCIAPMAPMLRSPKYLAPRSVFKRSRLTELWRRRKISNFEYIMQLNIMAGRTYNDITQYPVFPWVLADYTSDTLNLNDHRVFRDLSKPVGALNPERLSQLIERYNHLDGFREEEKFLYGSHYSSPGVILYYLIRQEPFTSMAIDLQSGRFDCPNRLFYDMAGCWKCCLTLTSDVKELVPEFFTCPEILINSNNFPLGDTQATNPEDRVSVSHVILPPWANGSAHEFVRMHRLALESEYVSENLHHWIDLIFGYKQRGPEAAKAHNVFHFLSYEGSVDLDTITDEVERDATESHIQNFGQTPSQLIVKEAHPSRFPAGECWKPLCSEVSRLRQLRCWTPSKQFGVSQRCGAVLSIHVLTDQIAVIYADLSIGTYKWSAKSSGRAPFFFKMDKLRALGCRAVSMSPMAIGAAAVSDSVSQSDSAKHRANEVAKELENEVGMGKIAIGSWSFGMTVGGTLKDALSRRNSRPMESSINLDASYFLLSCGYWDDTIKMHTLDGVKLRCSASGGHRGPINCLSIGDDGAVMVTGGNDATCRVWVVDHPQLAMALVGGFMQASLGISEGEGQERLLSCCRVLWGHISPISCLSFSTELDVVVSGSLDGLICVHTVRQGKFIRSIRLSDQVGAGRNRSRTVAVRKIALDSNGIFVAHTDDNMLHMYTVNGTSLCSVDAGDTLHAMVICSGGEMLVTGGDHCYVVIRTLRDLGVRCVLDLSSHGPIRSISFTPAESNPAPQFMYIGTDDGMVTIVDVDPDYDDGDTEDDGLPAINVHDGRSKSRW